MARLYGEKEDINSNNVKNFFNERANKGLESDLSIVFLQNKETSEKRNLEGIKFFNEKFDITSKKILEIGCGIGRWAEAIYSKCDSYLGIDYAEDLIEIAKKSYDYENCKFQVMSAMDIKVEELLIEPPFDIILISGVLMYINDSDLTKVIDSINLVSTDDKKLFIMEPISCLETRLTLKDFYSEELESDYNAVYRTENEYLEFFKRFNSKTITVEDMYKDLNHRSETKYKLFTIE